jgi:hypothetical protein
MLITQYIFILILIHRVKPLSAGTPVITMATQTALKVKHLRNIGNLIIQAKVGLMAFWLITLRPTLLQHQLILQMEM